MSAVDPREDHAPSGVGARRYFPASGRGSGSGRLFSRTRFDPFGRPSLRGGAGLYTRLAKETGELVVGEVQINNGARRATKRNDYALSAKGRLTSGTARNIARQWERANELVSLPRRVWRVGSPSTTMRATTTSLQFHQYLSTQTPQFWGHQRVQHVPALARWTIANFAADRPYGRPRRNYAQVSVSTDSRHQWIGKREFCRTGRMHGVARAQASR